MLATSAGIKDAATTVTTKPMLLLPKHLRFSFLTWLLYIRVWVLCLPLCICVKPSSLSQRLWLMSFTVFCAQDLFPDLILWKGQPEILKKWWTFVDYTMSDFFFPEEALPIKSRSQNWVLSNCQHPCSKTAAVGHCCRTQLAAKTVLIIQSWCFCGASCIFETSGRIRKQWIQM